MEIEGLWLMNRTGRDRLALQDLSKAAFKRVVCTALWQEEWEQRVCYMRASSRLHHLASALQAERAVDVHKHERRWRWSPAAYLDHLGQRSLVRLASCLVSIGAA